MVVATQNPIEYEGTYPLPEAQLDRFMFKVLVPYSPPEVEVEILRRYHHGFDAHDLDGAGLGKVLSAYGRAGHTQIGAAGYGGGRHFEIHRRYQRRQPPLCRTWCWAPAPEPQLMF